MRLLLILLGILVAGSTFAHPVKRVKCTTTKTMVVFTKTRPAKKVWVPAHWQRTPKGRVWVKGHWKRV